MKLRRFKGRNKKQKGGGGEGRGWRDRGESAMDRG